VDSGVVPILPIVRPILNFRIACPPKILVFDLATDELLIKYVFPESNYVQASLFGNIVVDIRGGRCGDAFAYVADLDGFGLLVFDARSRKSWRVSHNYFYPFPTYGTITVAGEIVQLMDGIFGLALSPVTYNG